MSCFLISSSIEGVLAQRLVRNLCPHCKQQHKPEPSQIRRINLTGDDPTKLVLYRNRGCEKCRYTGYLGRSAIFEIARVSEDFRRLEECRMHDLRDLFDRGHVVAGQGAPGDAGNFHPRDIQKTRGPHGCYRAGLDPVNRASDYFFSRSLRAAPRMSPSEAPESDEP